jgi:hypothetical protein
MGKKIIRDMKTLHDYRDTHPYCEVCGDKAMLTPHHLRSILSGGKDTDDNLISLCHLHHTGVCGLHTLGIVNWCNRFLNKFRGSALGKIQAAINELA